MSGFCVTLAAAQEVATVELEGEPVFAVAAVAGESAIERADRIGDRLRSRLATDEALAPVRVTPVGDSALVLVGQDTVATVTPLDAEVAAARPVGPEEAGAATQQLAREWAASLCEAFSRIAAEERAPVVVRGTTLFEVGGTAELRAARRAAAIGVRILEVANAEAEPPPVRAVRVQGGARVVAGERVVAGVSAADAAAHDAEPLALATEWAAEIEQTIRTVRQAEWLFALRTVAIALLATLVVVLLDRLFRRVTHRITAKRLREMKQDWGLRLMAAEWVLTVLQFVLWTGLAIFILWLVPRTRPFIDAAATRLEVSAVRSVAWLFGEGLVVTLIAVTTILIARFVGAVIRQIVLTFGMRQEGRIALRAGTLAGTAAAIAQLLVLFFGLITVLAELNVDPVPLLASAGVVGIALGFGVQTLIRDFFTGFFILLEDQYGVGDIVRVGDVTGQVERFTLRITQLRGMDGSVTSIPNGEVLNVTNLSKDWAQVVLDVRVALGEDVDRATAVIAATAKALTDEAGNRVRGEPEVLGVETVDPAARAITIRVVLKTAPLERFAITRELRRRILDAFAEAGIQAPPQSIVTMTDGGGGV